VTKESKIRAKSSPELAIKISREAKEESREEELWALREDIPQQNEVVEQEQEYRKILDRDIEQARERLLGKKNG